MTPTVWLGLLLTLVAGLLSGNCMLPMKFVKHWEWENTWLVFSVVSLLILPWALALVLVDHVFSVYAALPSGAFVAPLAFGAGWGIAQVLFGLSITRLGMALGYAIIVGLGALLGTLVPLLVKNRDILGTGRGMFILGGIGVMVAGIVVSARAGLQRERAAGAASRGGSYPAALAVAIVCGLLAPMLNYAFAFGQSIGDEAVRHGSSRAAAGYAIWPIALLGGLVPNLAYSIWLLNRNGTWMRFRYAWGREVWFGCLMGVAWMGAFAIYGLSSVFLGVLGVSVGWALFQIFMIMTANISGVFTGEWHKAPRQAKRDLWVGLALLALATSLIASANR